MKALALGIAILLSGLSFAGTTTTSYTVRAKSMSEMENKFQDALSDLRRGRRLPGVNCDGPYKVYSASGVRVYYRANRNGELEKRYSQTIKFSCRE